MREGEVVRRQRNGLEGEGEREGSLREGEGKGRRKKEGG